MLKTLSAFVVFVALVQCLSGQNMQTMPHTLNDTNYDNERYSDMPIRLDSVSLKQSNLAESNNVKSNVKKSKKISSKAGKTFKQANLKQLDSNKAKSKRADSNRVKSLLTQNFEFDLNAWVVRLAQIASSTDGSSFLQGVCGTCLLHAYEIIAEILLYGNNPPAQGGYFFDTARGISPFISFRQRHSLLYDTLNDITEYYVIPASDASEIFGNSVRLSYASGISLLPQFEWRYVGYGVVPNEVGRILEGVLRSRVGTLYVASMIYYQAGVGITQHGLVLVRVNGGVRVLATNIINATTQGILRFGRLNTNLSQLENAIAYAGGERAQIAALGLVEISGRYALPFASSLSFSDCSGEGESRRGNAAIPSASALNQCSSGRCNQ